MKRVRMTFRPDGVEVHPVYHLLAGGAEYLSSVELVNWNVAADPAGFLVYAEGDRERFAAALEAIPEVVHQEFISVGADAFYVYHTCRKTPMTDELFETFSNRSLLVVFPMTYHDDGASTATVVGPQTEIQATMDEVPDGLEVDIEAIGGPEVGEEGVLAALSDRQREAVEVALAVGYYETPRQATSEDVAEVLDCAPSTASKHLRRAESRLLQRLLG